MDLFMSLVGDLPDLAILLTGAVVTGLVALLVAWMSRLENATKSVTNVFWWIIFAFLLGAMAMNGRHSSDMVSTALIFLHMAGIGLVLALIVVMDQPFRGETSVPATPIAEALAARPLPSN